MQWLAWALLLAKSYQAEGLVLEVQEELGRLVVSHKAIPGVMPAMSMPLAVRDQRQLRGLAPGVYIDFELVLDGAGTHARRIRVRLPENAIEQDGRRVPLAPPKETVAVGQLVPDFSLTDSEGQQVSLAAWRGNLVAVQFLYSRCPLPAVCPRLAATFARLDRRFASRGVVLLSITLDPLHDTPAVLAEYARLWRPGARWRFLTGSVDEIRDVAARFGIVYWPEEGVITHTSTIGLIGRDGRLLARVEGLSFSAQQLGDLIERHLAAEEHLR